MENYSGIISLLLACIEFVLFINLLIFAQKNEVNNLIISLVGLLFGYQAFEFIICNLDTDSHLMIYLAFLMITFLPPLLLNITLGLGGYGTVSKRLIYLPAILIAAYYPTILSEFVVTRCTILFAAYDIPFADLYGIIYYTPVFVSLILLGNMIKNNKYSGKRSNIIIFTIGIVIAFIPTMFIILIFPSLIEFIESLLCKSASIIAITASVFAMRNKNESF